MNEQADTKVKEGPQRRKPMSDAQKDKMRESLRKTRERKKAEAAAAVAPVEDGDFLQGHIPEGPVWEPAVDVKTGLSREDQAAIGIAIKLNQEEARIREAALPENVQKLMVYREIQVDAFNKRRFYVELTPSMCDHPGCNYDAAVKAGATDWHNAPLNQKLDDGKTVGQKLIAMKEFHKATEHVNRALNDHIITADELHKRQWGIGQDIRGDFLTGVR